MLSNHHDRAKSIRDGGWSAFLRILSGKAVAAGKTVVAVCAGGVHLASLFGVRCAGAHRLVSVRWPACPACGTGLHRDHTAALTIVRLGRPRRGAGQAPQARALARWGERRLSISRMYPGACQRNTEKGQKVPRL